MATIQGVNGIHINQNGNANSGTRIFSAGKAVPGTSTNTTLIKFTNTGGGSNFGISIRWYIGAERQSGTIAENWFTAGYGLYNSTGTTWTNTNEFTAWYTDGNGIIATSTNISGTALQLQASQGDTGAYVNFYVEAECAKWDQITVSY